MHKLDHITTHWYMFSYFNVALAVLVLLSANIANAVQIIVPGTSDMWLAGMPDGTTASGSDVAPDESPVLVMEIGISPSDMLTFSATGAVSHTGGCPTSNCLGPDGGTFTTHTTGDENGIASVRAPFESLLGVFLTDEQPDLSPAPASLDFQVMGIDFTSLSPELKQPFFIGDGLTGSGDIQQFVVPVGSTRLYLGTMDAFGWFNNNGSFTVNIPAVPLPASLWLFSSGLLGMIGVCKRKKAF